MKCNIIVAIANNNGIGINGKLPWNLRKELAYFSKMTKSTADPLKKNAVVMGRRTWESIPEKFRPLPGRLNVVLTRTNGKLRSFLQCNTKYRSKSRSGPEAVLAAFPDHSQVLETRPQLEDCRKVTVPRIIKEEDRLKEAVKDVSLSEEVLVHSNLEDAIKDLHNRKDIETAWVIGGSSVYDEAMKSSYCHRLYITNILKDYDCDTFFPKIGSQYVCVSDPAVPSGIQEENGIQFEYKVYENTEYSSVKNI